jgi:glycosyltransferase 2 family protein
MASKKSRNAWLAPCVKIVVTVGIIAAILWRLGWHDILATVAHARPLWLILALAIFIISGGLGVWQWQIILHNRKIPLSFGRAFMLYFIGLFFNTMSFGMVAGDAVKIAYLKYGDGKGKAGFAATFLDRFAGLWTMLGFAVIGCLFLIKQKALESASMTLTVIGLFAMFIIFGGIALFLLSSRMQSIVYALIDALPLPRKAAIEAVFRETLQIGRAHV